MSENNEGYPRRADAQPAERIAGTVETDTDFENAVQSQLEKPQRLRAESWRYVLKRSLHEFSRNKCTDLAAALTYYTMLSLFPGLLAVVSLLGVVGQAETTTRSLLSLLEEFASPQVVETLRQPIEQLASAPSAGLALAAGLLGAIWSASGYVGAFGRAMNQIYAVEEGRPFYQLKPLMLLVTLFLLVAAAFMGALFVLSGPFAQTLGNYIGLGESALLLWNIVKWPVMAAFAVMLVAVLYYGTPNVKHTKFRLLSIGAFFALAILALATFGFFNYVSNFGNYNKTYGAIGGVIVLLLWIWIANLSLLFGAVLDAEIERGRELQAGYKAEDSLNLPPRNTAGVLKQKQQKEQDVREGKQIRIVSEIAAVDEIEQQAKSIEREESKPHELG
ncbi:YihY/virulence factor BrkB family protein [Glutamicibacter sp. NPDC087344]|uniref:YihY/virulence factor BrkB family protein n=1 Tax=Glutamicibacter sp. NPDC087344 TaxID=3363994 RepID=UPI0038301625